MTIRFQLTAACLAIAGLLVTAPTPTITQHTAAQTANTVALIRAPSGTSGGAPGCPTCAH